MTDGVTLRVARPTDHLDEVVRFYSQGPGLTVLGSFQDHYLLVFYLPDSGQWQEAIDRMRAAGYQPVPSFNPYWDRAGRAFEDPDGCRVVLQNAAWP